VALSLVISASAQTDLLDMWAWIAEDNLGAADGMLDRVLEVANRLAEWPEMGRAREELREGLRSFAVGSHVGFYRAGAERLEVVRVLHGRRDVDTLFIRPGSGSPRPSRAR